MISIPYTFRFCRTNNAEGVRNCENARGFSQYVARKFFFSGCKPLYRKSQPPLPMLHSRGTQLGRSVPAALSGGGLVYTGVRRVAEEVLAVLLQPVEVGAARLVRLPGAGHVDALVADGLGTRVLGAVACGGHRVARVHGRYSRLLGRHGAATRATAGERQEQSGGEQRRGDCLPSHRGACVRSTKAFPCTGRIQGSVRFRQPFADSGYVL